MARRICDLRLGRRALRHRVEALHAGGESIEEFLQYRRSFGNRHFAGLVLAEADALAQCDASGRAHVASPLSLPAARDQIAPAVVLEQIDRRRKHFAAFAPGHFEQVVVAQSKSEAHQRTEGPIGNSLESGFFLEALLCGRLHRHLAADSEVARASITRPASRREGDGHTTVNGYLPHPW